MKQNEAPLFEALVKISKPHLSLHVPGHKLGNDFDKEGYNYFQSILRIDQTEIEGLDDLHHAEGVILKAEQLAAKAFGAEETKFLVGGTTSGILSLLLTTVQAGGKCLIERNSHKSVFNGVKLARGIPVFIPPRFDNHTGIPLGVNPDDVERLLRTEQTIQAVVITSPNYYGQTADIRTIAQIAHSYSVPLIVDEAHGAHFHFSPHLPATALEQGADAVIQSTHKTLPAMTMSSMLHLKGTRINRNKVKLWLATIQSSSPSYPLMASLDLARRHMAAGDGRRKLQTAIELITQFRQELQNIAWIRVAPTDDPLRMVVLVPKGWSKAVQHHLQAHFIYPEIVEPDRLVFVFSGGTNSDDTKRLMQAFQSFQPLQNEKIDHVHFVIPQQQWIDVQLQEVAHDQTEWCRLEDSVGRISAAMIIPYPPGIPFVLERQKLDEAVIHTVRELIKAGIHLHGVEEERIQVYVET